jgi:hypothetical protein
MMAMAVIVAGLVADGCAETQAQPVEQRNAVKSKPLPVTKPPNPEGGKPCAQYGPGFAVIDGTQTCVKIGGSTSVGVGSGR